MKQIILAWVLLAAAYFGWRYLPPRPKFFARQFLKTHAVWVSAIFGLLVGFLFWQADTTTKLF